MLYRGERSRSRKDHQTKQNGLQIDLVSWSERAEVKSAWQKLAERERFEKDALEKAAWVFKTLA
jgi:hypothetical protein